MCGCRRAELAVAARCAATRGGPRRKVAAKAVTSTPTRPVHSSPTSRRHPVFAATFREPDRDVDRHELAWWLTQVERLGIRAELATGPGHVGFRP